MENVYETLQNIYIRPYLESAISKTIDTVATLKNEVIIPNEPQYPREALSPPEETESPRETLSPPEETESLSPPEELIDIWKPHTICDICGGKYSYFNKKRHYGTKKHLSATLPSSPHLPSSLLPLSSLPLEAIPNPAQ